MLSTKHQSGYIALTSAIIIVLVLITITVILSISGFLGRFNILDGEYKEKSSGLTEACVEIAIIDLAQGIPVPPLVLLTDGTCFIDSVADSGTNKVIKAHADYNNSFTNLMVTVDGITFSVLSWEECANPC